MTCATRSADQPTRYIDLAQPAVIVYDSLCYWTHISRAPGHSELGMDTIEGVKRVLRDTLQLGARADGFDAGTALLGSLPEFDSMAVVSVITAIEESFGVTIDDDEISAANFQTIGSLSDFVQRKLGS